jgi:antitoxin MazE
MDGSIIKIGNSQGVIIPKRILKKLGSTKRFNIREKDGCLIFVPLQEGKPRENWDKLFSLANKNGENNESDPFSALSNDFDNTEWTW